MKRSDSVLWQKLLHQQTWQKGKVTTQKTPQKKFDYTAIADRSVGVTTATQLVWLYRFTSAQPSQVLHTSSRVSKNIRLLQEALNVIT